MSKRLSNRKRLFDKFSSQLHLLNKEGILEIDLKFDKTYICPICTNQFEENDLVSSTTSNFLTEEDAPPDKLGGNRIALTCKNCNSKAGHQIDNHLINRIKQIDEANFYKGSKHYRNFDFEGTQITAELFSNGDGTLSVLHKTKNNNPTLLDKFIFGIKNKTVGPILDLKPKDYGVISDRVNLALLKTNYIITFAKFGYIFLLDSYYDNIREQIRDMDKGYDGQIFLKDQFDRDETGTYYVMNNGAKSVFNVFNLTSDYSETLIGGILPLPNLSAEQIRNNLVKNGCNIGEVGKVGVSLNTRNYDPNADIFSDMDEIKKIIKWKNAP